MPDNPYTIPHQGISESHLLEIQQLCPFVSSDIFTNSCTLKPLTGQLAPTDVPVKTIALFIEEPR